MFEITYHLKNTRLRNDIDLTAYRDDIEYTIMLFPMLELLEVTKRDFTISINAKTTKVKNRIVRAFGHKLATISDLGKTVCYLTNAAEVIIAKNVRTPVMTYQ